jgi:glutamyl-tRNA reductase
MGIVVSGANHKNSPLWLREKAALSGIVLFDTRKRLRALPGVEEVVVLSTCNRVEFYLQGPDTTAVMARLREFLQAEYGLAPADLERFFYFRQDDEALTHLFAVAAGADSMVVGEFQILGQVQHSFEQARMEGTLGPRLEEAGRLAVEVTRRIREETEFASSPVSAGSVAVELVKKQLGSLKNRSAIILGAGDMGVVTARVLTAHGIGSILVVNRTLSRAQEVAHSLGGKAVDYSELQAQIQEGDILVTSTSAPHIIIKKTMIEQIMKNRPQRPLFIIDLALPRNVDPEIARLEAVTLVNVDDLQELASKNAQERMAELERVQAIIQEEVERFSCREKKPGLSLLDLDLG